MEHVCFTLSFMHCSNKLMEYVILLKWWDVLIFVYLIGSCSILLAFSKDFYWILLTTRYLYWFALNNQININKFIWWFLLDTFPNKVWIFWYFTYRMVSKKMTHIIANKVKILNKVKNPTNFKLFVNASYH